MIVAFTGHRIERLGEATERTKSAIEEFLRDARPDRVISGMATGVDQYAAQIAHSLDIPWIAAVPFLGQALRWTREQARAYLDIIRTANQIEVISESYHPGVYHKRDRWMVDRCDVLAAVWDGKENGGTYETIRYAQRIGKEIRYLEWR